MVRLTSAMVRDARRMWAAGISVDSIALAVGCTKWGLIDYIRRHRDEFPHRKHRAGWWAEQLARYDGLDAKATARKLRVSAESVYAWRRRLYGDRA